jgi:hypothetical protein
MVVSHLQEIRIILMFRIEPPKPVHSNCKQIISSKDSNSTTSNNRSNPPFIQALQSDHLRDPPRLKNPPLSIFYTVYLQPFNQHLLFDDRFESQRKTLFKDE